MVDWLVMGVVNATTVISLILTLRVQFALLESASVDADLENLKDELSGSSKVE